MTPRPLRLLIVLPVLLAVWVAANSIGITQAVNQLTGSGIPDGVQVSALREAVDIRPYIDEEAAEEARRTAVEALRNQVREEYGDEAAQMVPADLTLAEATRIAALVGSGTELSTLEDRLEDAETVQTTEDATRKGVPFMNAKAYRLAERRLETLPVKGKAAKTGYDRDQFGSSWTDSAGDFAITGNGCDTRNDILARDLTGETVEDDCKVIDGTLRYEPYTGQKDRPFGCCDDDYDTDLDIEHVRALGDIWVHGGQNMTEAERAAVANDPLNLMAVDPSSNRAKGDADFATWLPPNKAYRCAYAARTIAVTHKYDDLWVTTAEKQALASVLAGCA